MLMKTRLYTQFSFHYHIICSCNTRNVMERTPTGRLSIILAVKEAISLRLEVYDEIAVILLYWRYSQFKCSISAARHARYMIFETVGLERKVRFTFSRTLSLLVFEYKSTCQYIIELYRGRTNFLLGICYYSERSYTRLEASLTYKILIHPIIVNQNTKDVSWVTESGFFFSSTRTRACMNMVLEDD